MSAKDVIANFLLHKELKLIRWVRTGPGSNLCEAIKISDHEYCPKCATKCSSVYDHRKVRLKDEPVRGKSLVLIITKRRFYCKQCRKPFTEPIPGVLPGRRTTEKYRRGVLWACENFKNLSQVRRAYRCSSSLVYKIYYEQLELRRRRNINYPWPSTIGIDEHFFKRTKGYRKFCTIFVDYDNNRVRELIEGRSVRDLQASVESIPGRENVKNAVIDLTGTYKKLVHTCFPNAKITADHFHVVKLLHPAINKYRKQVTGDIRKNPIRKLLLLNGCRLKSWTRHLINTWLLDHPELKEVYDFKERMHRLYRCKGYKRAKKSFTKLVDDMSKSKIPEIIKLRKTLLKWSQEILNYFKTKLTNGRTEAYNKTAKLVQRLGSGYKNFPNYRLRVLNTCS